MPGVRTYIPGLRLVLRTVHRYMTNHQNKLSQTLTEAQYTCLLATIAAVAECLAVLGEGEVLP